jgi:hypothetical protein
MRPRDVAHVAASVFLLHLPYKMPHRLPADVTAAQSPYRPTGLRLRRKTATPTVTVILASHRSRAELDRCLASLVSRCERAGAELIVVRTCTPEEAAFLRERAPSVRFLEAPELATTAERRRLGMLQAEGDIVVFTDDERAAPDGWLPDVLGRTTA